MNRKLVLGVLIALSATAAVQPAAAQWSDRWGTEGAVSESASGSARPAMMTTPIPDTAQAVLARYEFLGQAVE